MTQEAIRALVCDLFLHGDRTFPFPSDADLLQQGICDSLGLVQLASALERQVPGLRIHDADVTPANLGSIDGIDRFLRSRSR